MSPWPCERPGRRRALIVERRSTTHRLRRIPRGPQGRAARLARASACASTAGPIGRATADIAAGDHVHTHNLATRLAGSTDYAYQPSAHSVPRPPGRRGAATTFMGYRRANGRVGTRNEIWILCTVGCVARTAQNDRRSARTRSYAGRVDGVHAFAHPFGCSQLGDDLAGTRSMLAALAAIPTPAAC